MKGCEAMTEITEVNSEPRPRWRAQARTAVRNYPEHKAQITALRAQMTLFDPEDTNLPTQAQREYMAVRFALQCTMGQYPRDWQTRLELIRLLYWIPDRLTLAGAAMRVPCSWETAQRWNAAFLQLVDAAGYAGEAAGR